MGQWSNEEVMPRKGKWKKMIMGYSIGHEEVIKVGMKVKDGEELGSSVRKLEANSQDYLLQMGMESGNAKDQAWKERHPYSVEELARNFDCIPLLFS